MLTRWGVGMRKRLQRLICQQSLVKLCSGYLPVPGRSFLWGCTKPSCFNFLLLLDLTSLEPNLTNSYISGSPTTIPSISQAQNVKMISDSPLVLTSINTGWMLFHSYSFSVSYFTPPSSVPPIIYKALIITYPG